MNEPSNLAVVQEAYGAFGRGDIDSLLRQLDPAVEWHASGPNALPWAGSYRGPEDTRRFFTALASHVDFESFVPATFVCDDDHVVVLGFARARLKRNGSVIENPWAHALVLKDRKVVSFRSYEDSAPALAAMAR